MGLEDVERPGEGGFVGFLVDIAVVFCGAGDFGDNAAALAVGGGAGVCEDSCGFEEDGPEEVVPGGGLGLGWGVSIVFL